MVVGDPDVPRRVGHSPYGARLPPDGHRGRVLRSGSGLARRRVIACALLRRIALARRPRLGLLLALAALSITAASCPLPIGTPLARAAPQSIAYNYDDTAGPLGVPPSVAPSATTRTFTVRAASHPAVGRPASAPSSTTSSPRRGATKGARGGAGPVRLGQAGEDAVRGAYDVGPKVPITVGGRGRIPDGLTDSTLTEVKNVASLSYTRQIRDFEAYAQQSGRTFDLFVRPGARLSGPLREADASGRINVREIP